MRRVEMPPVGRLTLSDALLAERLPDLLRGCADARYRLFQLFFGDAERLGPVTDLVRVVDINALVVGRASLSFVV
jgi:hypothetical protein